MRKLSEATVKRILGYRVAGASAYGIALYLRLPRTTVYRICSRKTWKQIPEQLPIALPEGFDSGAKWKNLPIGLKARFLHWAPTGPANECWLWIGPVGGNGYGKVSYLKDWQAAHRYARELANGPIPKGMHVLHKCDVPLCVNPNHLFLGTHRDNMRDMATKGRQRGGWSTQITAARRIAKVAA